MSINSDEVNYLVYRYLLESGFSHSAFCFAHESLIARTTVADAEVPPAALVAFLQKGLQYCEIEYHLTEDGQERPCDEPFHLLRPHLCRTTRGGSTGKKKDAPDAAQDVAMADNVEVAASDVTLLQGHTSEVFTCAFNPRADILASGSGDATARIWKLPAASDSASRPSSSSSSSSSASSVVLKHASEAVKTPSRDKSQDVTTLDWNLDGSRLATGSYDGKARIWGLDGTLQQTLHGHTNVVFAVQWSPDSHYLVSGSVDKSAIVWEASTGAARQQYNFHSAPILDVDWATPSIFATASTDKSIQVCSLGERTAVRSWVGHTDEVNGISWSPNKGAGGKRDNLLLASCSDDGTARLWNLGNMDRLADKSDRDTGSVATFTGHRKAVYSIKWAPAGEGSANPSKPPVIGTASFDSTVKLWDPTTATCKHTLAKHTAMVYTLAFSPDADLVASGATDRCVHIWSVKDGSLVRTYTASAGIFDLSFNSTGTKLAAACGDSAVAIIDMRK